MNAEQAVRARSAAGSSVRASPARWQSPITSTTVLKVSVATWRLAIVSVSFREAPQPDAAARTIASIGIELYGPFARRGGGGSTVCSRRA